MVKKALIAFLLAFTILQAGEKIVSFSFDPDKVKLGSEKGYVTVMYDDFSYVNPIGAPMLPNKGGAVLIPAGSSFEGFEILSMTTKNIGSGYKIIPQQKPVPISFKVPEEFIEPDEEFYEKNAFYPSLPIKFGQVGNMNGFSLASFLIYPVIYNPVSGEIRVVTNLVVKIKYEEGKKMINPITSKQLSIIRRQLKGLIVNPEDIDAFAPPLRN